MLILNKNIWFNCHRNRRSLKPFCTINRLLYVPSLCIVLIHSRVTFLADTVYYQTHRVRSIGKFWNPDFGVAIKHGIPKQIFMPLGGKSGKRIWKTARKKSATANAGIHIVSRKRPLYKKTFLQFPNKMVRKGIHEICRKDFLTEIHLEEECFFWNSFMDFAFYRKIEIHPIGRTQIICSRSLLYRYVFAAHNTV